MVRHSGYHACFLTGLDPSPQPRGFTLPETIVTVVLIGILSAIATPSFLRWVNDRRIEDAMAQVDGAIREAQAEAIRKNQECIVIIDPPNAQIRSDPTDCLPTGSRDLTKLGIPLLSTPLSKKDPEISLNARYLQSYPQSSYKISFSYQGTTNDSGIIVVYREDGAGQARCLVIASGIGLTRTGRYTHPRPADPPHQQNCVTLS